MFQEHFGRLVGVWRESLAGGVVIVVCVAIGWRWARSGQGLLVGIVRWWLEHVLRPLVQSRGWSRRAATIAVNNALICAAVVSLGAAGHAAWLGVGGIGLGLGIALRLLLPTLAPEPSTDEPRPEGRRALKAVGLALNVLEVPAIMLSAGLSLAQGPMSHNVSLADAWATFGLLVVPMLIISAAGEALWMTVDHELSGIRPEE